MISYELAKELKDAGFKFVSNKEEAGVYAFSPFVGKESSGIYNYGLHSDYVFFYCDGWYCLPNLSELIEACGKDFHCLVHTTKGGIDSDREFWSAGTDNVVLSWHNASTPEEAVASLWLALNKKS